MQNLTRLWDRESRWYKIGPVSIARGVPKRAFFYFVGLEVFFFLLGLLPLPPFSWMNWEIRQIVFPCVGAFYLMDLRKGGKTPENYLMTMLRYHLAHKHRSAYRPIQKQTYRWNRKGYTLRWEPRRKEQRTNE